MVWYIDFEGYHFNKCYYVKEIAILGTQCFNYYVKNPRSIPDCLRNPTTRFQFNSHKIKWNFGDYTFTEVITDIQKKVNGETIYAKGREKCEFLQRWLPQLTEIDWIPSFSKLNNCLNEVCNLGHSYNCARRKVYEMQYADKQHNIIREVEKPTLKRQFAFSDADVSKIFKSDNENIVTIDQFQSLPTVDFNISKECYCKQCICLKDDKK